MRELITDAWRDQAYVPRSVPRRCSDMYVRTHLPGGQESANQVKGHGSQPEPADDVLTRLVASGAWAPRVTDRNGVDLAHTRNGNVEQERSLSSQQYAEEESQPLLLAEEGVRSDSKNGLYGGSQLAYLARNYRGNPPEPSVVHMHVAAMR